MQLEKLIEELQKIKQKEIDQYDMFMRENRPDLAKLVDFDPEIYIDTFMTVEDYEKKFGINFDVNKKTTFVYVGASKDVNIGYSEDGCLLIINAFAQD
jgi:hypothetical protein